MSDPSSPSSSPAVTELDADTAESNSPEMATTDSRVVRLEARLGRLEGQVRALQDRVAEMTAGDRTRKQRALLFRLALLAVLLALFFIVQMQRSGAS